MKQKSLHIAGSMSLLLVLPSAADVIYSNLKDISIPADYAGVYLDLNTGNWNTNLNSPQSGWDINPFFGGSVLWNSPTFQPVRSGTGNSDAVVNLAAGVSVSSGSTYSTFVQGAGGENPGGPGYGISENHIGAGSGQFVAGQEGYIGFQLDGSNYGWMRVVLTNNTGGALIKEWAYDNGGASLAVANVKRTGSDVSLDSTYGAFTISSVINDSSGTTNVIKTGSGTINTTATNTYTGTTSVDVGRLNVNGSLDVASNVTVAAAATLGGDGTINGNVTLNGILAPGKGGSTDRTLNIDGVITANIGSAISLAVAGEAAADRDQLILGSIDLSNTSLALTFTDSTVTELGAGGGAIFSALDSAGKDAYTSSSVYKIISGTTTNMFANVTDVLSAGELSYFGLTGTQYRYTEGGQTFWLASGSTYLVAIPETSTSLLAAFSVLGLALKRRRLNG